MTEGASQISSFTTVYSAVYWGGDQRKHQRSASLAFVWGIHRGPVNSPHKWPVARKMLPFDDVIMIVSEIYYIYGLVSVATTLITMLDTFPSMFIWFSMIQLTLWKDNVIPIGLIIHQQLFFFVNAECNVSPISIKSPAQFEINSGFLLIFALLAQRNCSSYLYFEFLLIFNQYHAIFKTVQYTNS